MFWRLIYFLTIFPWFMVKISLNLILLIKLCMSLQIWKQPWYKWSVQEIWSAPLSLAIRAIPLVKIFATVNCILQIELHFFWNTDCCQLRQSLNQKRFLPQRVPKKFPNGGHIDGSSNSCNKLAPSSPSLTGTSLIFPTKNQERLFPGKFCQCR